MTVRELINMLDVDEHHNAEVRFVVGVHEVVPTGDVRYDGGVLRIFLVEDLPRPVVDQPLPVVDQPLPVVDQPLPAVE